MDRLNAMAMFLSIVDTGSLSAAGRRLGMPIATVSRKLSQLEAHLGATLIARTSRRLSLTDAGKDYVEACRRIVEEVDEAEKAAAGEYSNPRGELTVTAPIVMGRLHVLPIVGEFLNAFPLIEVRMLLLDRFVSLHDEAVDVAIRIGALPDSSLVASKVGSTSRVACASPAYLERRGRPRHPNELSRHDCVSFESLASASRWMFGAGPQEIAVPVQSRLVVNTAEAALEAAIAGNGITRLLCYQVEEACRDGRLEIILPEFEPAAWPVNLVHAGGRRLPLKLRAFLDFLSPGLKRRLVRWREEALLTRRLA